MNVLLTGAFGNIGRSTLDELLARGHWVRCFDLPTRANLRAASAYAGRAQLHWGDLLDEQALRAAMTGVDVVVHLAFVIPALSVTGRRSEDDPRWAYGVNVGGTRNLLEAMQAQARPPSLLFTSSLHIYGRTQHVSPPRKITDTPDPIEHYAKHKVECEHLIRTSGLRWSIFRLAASLPVRLILDESMFDVPLDNRIEFVHTRDVGLAIANALTNDEVWGRVWHIGGGAKCQLYQRDLVEQILEAGGVGMLPEQVFTQTPYPVDWLDTKESERVLSFQRRTLNDYVQELRKRLGGWRHLIKVFRPVIRAWIMLKSRIRLQQKPQLR
ncbi:MAG: NAD(P)-dependent oxidoreductase [Anaerolineales bacterium]|nr:NAD(P)-dependent oxidoreductase [Anaerolineales bacterium]